MGGDNVVGKREAIDSKEEKRRDSGTRWAVNFRVGLSWACKMAVTEAFVRCGDLERIYIHCERRFNRSYPTRQPRPSNELWRNRTPGASAGAFSRAINAALKGRETPPRNKLELSRLNRIRHFCTSNCHESTHAHEIKIRWFITAIACWANSTSLTKKIWWYNKEIISVSNYLMLIQLIRYYNY